MFTQSNRTYRNTTLFISLALSAAAGCSGGDALTGTWQDLEATTPLPAAVGGGLLEVDSTLVFDGGATPPTVDMHLDLAFEALADTVDVTGTYEDDGSALTLTFTDFTIDETSGNSAFVSEDGAPCINLQGFGGAPVCFPAPQSNVYVLNGATLSIVIDQAIAGAPVTETPLALTPVP